MNSEKLHNWIQIIGIVGVVASLVFVGLQLKQSQNIAIASQYQARLDAANSHYTTILQCEPGLRVLGTEILADMKTNEELPMEIRSWAAGQPVEELAYRSLVALLFLKGHDNVFFQYQAGFLSDEAWQALRIQLKAGLHDPRNWSRAVFEDNPEVWRASYRELIWELIAEGPPSSR